MHELIVYLCRHHLAVCQTIHQQRRHACWHKHLKASALAPGREGDKAQHIRVLARALLHHLPDSAHDSRN
jgi:hypothetical protein